MAINPKSKQLTKSQAKDKLQAEKQAIKQASMGALTSQGMEDLFKDEGNPNEIVKELFANEGIKTRTDLSNEEISLISRMYYIAEELKNDRLTNLMDTFLELKVSKDRKSRDEFVKAFIGSQPEEKKTNFFQRMFNVG